MLKFYHGKITYCRGVFTHSEYLDTLYPPCRFWLSNQFASQFLLSCATISQMWHLCIQHTKINVAQLSAPWMITPAPLSFFNLHLGPLSLSPSRLQHSADIVRGLRQVFQLHSALCNLPGLSLLPLRLTVVPHKEPSCQPWPG